MTEHAAVRLGRMVRERRKELKLTQADVQAKGGPSTATLRLIENGKHTDFRPATSQPLEDILQWQPGSIAAILKGQTPTVVPDAHQSEADIAHLRSAIESARASGDHSEQAKLEYDLAVVYENLGRFARAAHETSEPTRLLRWVELSFLADEVDSAVPLFAPDPSDDPSAIENYVSEVEQLTSATESLSDAVHKAVLDAFNGDVAQLRHMKREVRRANHSKHGFQQQPTTRGERDEVPPPLHLADAARTGDSEGIAQRDAQDEDAEGGQGSDG